MNPTLKLTEIQKLIDLNEALKSQVYRVREPGDDELRRVQGLLSEVRDLLWDAAKKEEAAQ